MPLSNRETVYVSACGAVWVGLLFLIPVMAPETVRAHLWAFDHFRDVPHWLRIALAAALLSLFIPSVNRFIWSGWAGLLRRLRLFPVLGYSLASAVSFAAFFLLRARNYALGDSALLIRRMAYEVRTQGHLITLDEPLELYLHSNVYRVLHGAFNVSVETSYALVSSMAGVGFVLTMLVLWRRVVEDLDRRTVALGLVFSAGAVQLFFGYLENYAVTAAAAILYVFLGYLRLQGRCRIVWPAFVLGIGISLHVLAGWLLPSLLYLWWVGGGPPGRRRIADLGWLVVGLVAPVAATLGACASAGMDLAEGFQATHLSKMKFLFLLDSSYKYYQYSFLSASHLKNVLNEILLTSLPGILALGFVGSFHRRAVDLKDPFLRFLILCALFLQVFALTWNTDLGAYRDWDLFALVGFVYVLLGGYMLVRTVSGERLRYGGLILIGVALLQSGPWIASNAVRTIPLEEVHADLHMAIGAYEASQGNFAEAIQSYEEVLRVIPDHPAAHLALGFAHRFAGDLPLAADHFEAYLRLAPHGRHADRVREQLRQIQGE